MNDLAEQALDALRVTGARIARRPLLAAGVAGAAAASVVAVAGARVGLVRATRPLTTWLGLEDGHGVRAGDALPGAAMLIALVVLLVLWLVVTELARHGAASPARVWWVAGAWAAPFALGPPLMDTSVYSGAAYGVLQRLGHSPYLVDPSHLHGRPVLFAVDAPLRDVASSAGPLGTLGQHLTVSISGGSALGAVLVLRAAALVAVVWATRVAAELAGNVGTTDPRRTSPIDAAPLTDRRAYAMTLVALNPLVLLYLVSAAHLDAIMIGFVAGAALAAARGHWWRALALATVGGMVVPVGLLAVPVLVAGHLAQRRGRVRAAVLIRDLGVAVATAAVCSVVVEDGLGWIRTAGLQFVVPTPFSAAGVLQRLVSVIVRDAAFDDLEVAARITTMAAAVSVIAYLLVTARHRSVVAGLTWAFLAAALLAPVLHPWYLLWALPGAAALAAAGGGRRGGRLPSARAGVVAVSAIGCLIDPPGFGLTTSHVLTVAALAAVALALAGAIAVRRWSLEIDGSLLGAGR